MSKIFCEDCGAPISDFRNRCKLCKNLSFSRRQRFILRYGEELGNLKFDLEKSNRSVRVKKQFKELGNPMAGKTVYGIWLKKYGKEEADRRRKLSGEKQSKSRSGSRNWMYGRPSPQGSGNGWSGWYHGHFFRSLRELSYMLILDKLKLQWESVDGCKDFRINYILDGKERTYTADYLVENRYLIEIKPKKLWNTQYILLKKEAALIFCKKHNLIYKLKEPKVLSLGKMVELEKNATIKFTKRYKEKFDKWVIEKTNVQS